MSNPAFEYYADLAAAGAPDWEASGRLPQQVEATRRILWDVQQKLEVGPQDTLLDVGCNKGLHLIPLSFAAAAVTGIDHPTVIAALAERFRGDNVQLIGGDFLSAPLSGPFTRILAYGVVNCLETLGDVEAFLDRALGLLAPGGRLLIGDLPNDSRKQRFLASSFGQRFTAEWRGRSSAAPAPTLTPRQFSNTLVFTDAVILGLVARARQAGFDAYLLPQPTDLPFGHTREDLLITARPA